MNTLPRLTSLLAVLVLLISASPAWAEGSGPDAVAKKFVKAYYMLDDSMADYLSADALTNENDVDMVDLYLRLRDDEARRRGYKMSYLQLYPILIKATVVEADDETAVVSLNTTALRSINPLYRSVGYIFCLIKEHEFDTTLTLVKEDGQWKVGPGALGPAI